MFTLIKYQFKLLFGLREKNLMWVKQLHVFKHNIKGVLDMYIYAEHQQSTTNNEVKNEWVLSSVLYSTKKTEYLM